MTTLRTYKFVVMPVLQQVDELGVVVGELSPPQPDTLFGVDGLMRYAAGWEEALARHVAQMNGAPPAELAAGVVAATALPRQPEEE